MSFRNGEIWELQLKGSGKTPYSRWARISLFLFACFGRLLPASSPNRKKKKWNEGQETVEPSSVPQWESSCVARPCISSASRPAELPGKTDVMDGDWFISNKVPRYVWQKIKKSFCSSKVLMLVTLFQSDSQRWACAEGSILQWQCENRKRYSDAVIHHWYRADILFIKLR